MRNLFKLETLKNDIVKKIEIGQIVPVVGDNVFFVKDNNGTNMLLQKYIIIQLINFLERKYGIDCSTFDETFIDNACSGYKGMSVLNRLVVKAGSNLSSVISEIYKECEIHKISYIDPVIKEFLELGNFPLIITTSYTNILEYHLNKNYREVYYLKEKKDTQDIGATDNTPFEKLEMPTVFHIFGVNILDCPFTENDFLKYLHALHNENSSPEKLMQYLNKRYILTLGCTIPDWTLRFLLYSFKSDKISDKLESSNRFEGGVLDINRNDELANFLEGIDYFYESSDLKNSFITELLFIIKKCEATVEKKKRVFISVFSSEDMTQPLMRKLIMSEVIYPLKEKYDIWFCEEQLDGYAGEAYWQKIRDGLIGCDYFMPILTPNLINFLEDNMTLIDSINPNPDQEQGFITEWKYAFDIWNNVHKRKSGFCIPFNLCNKFERIQKAFCQNNLNSGIEQLRRLIFGDGDGSNAMGNQIVSDVKKINI